MRLMGWEPRPRILPMVAERRRVGKKWWGMYICREHIYICLRVYICLGGDNFDEDVLSETEAVVSIMKY